MRNDEYLPMHIPLTSTPQTMVTAAAAKVAPLNEFTSSTCSAMSNAHKMWDKMRLSKLGRTELRPG